MQAKPLPTLFSCFILRFSLSTSSMKYIPCFRKGNNEFKSCLRALGYDLPMLEDGQPEPEFEAILDSVDLNRDGVVSLQVIIVFKLRYWKS